MSAVEPTPSGYEPEGGPSPLLDWLATALENWKLLLLLPLACAVAMAAATFWMTPAYTARTVILPPQQNPQSSALAALSSLATTAAGVRTSADLYGSLLQSAGVEERLVEQFRLVEVYDVRYRADARKRLQRSTRVEVGKKDGLISIDVEDEDPQRAADLANAYAAELRRVTAQLALTEAQQRRVFFETRLTKARDDLTRAQRDLQSSGFSGGALRAEPRLAAESYARARAEVTAAEVRLVSLRNALAENAPEVQRQLAQLAALRANLAKLEAQDGSQGDAQYIARFREYKYQESLFELFSRQYEAARTDEAREGALIQVVDAAKPPEKRSKPRRRVLVLGALLAGLALAMLVLIGRRAWERTLADPSQSDSIARLRRAVPFGRR